MLILIRRALCPGRVRSSHDPWSRLPFWFLLLFLEHPSEHWIQKCDPREILAESPRNPWCWPLWVATFGTLKKRAVLPYDLNLEPTRTDQGPQHTHHIPQHTHHIPQLMVLGHICRLKWHTWRFKSMS